MCTHFSSASNAIARRSNGLGESGHRTSALSQSEIQPWQSPSFIRHAALLLYSTDKPDALPEPSVQTNIHYNEVCHRLLTRSIPTQTTLILT